MAYIYLNLNYFTPEYDVFLYKIKMSNLSVVSLNNFVLLKRYSAPFSDLFNYLFHLSDALVFRGNTIKLHGWNN